MLTKDLPSYARARQAKRVSYDSQVIHAILDAGLIGHLGFVADGRPMVIPLAFGRESETIYLHGASKTRFIQLCRDQAPLCFSVTLLDGIVAARSAFHHSANYRSAIVHGHSRLVTDDQERLRGLRLITEHLLPGRYEEVRPVLEKERKATGLIALEIEYASAKVRAGPPIDEVEDLDLRLWGGVIPVTTSLGRAVPDGHTPDELPEPASARRAREKFAA